jgi:hypothetical protein
MFTTPRNQIEVDRLDIIETTNIDTLFEICDAEFNSRADVHASFADATRPSLWMLGFLIPQIKLIAAREHIHCTDYIAECVAKPIACMWFGCSTF